MKKLIATLTIPLFLLLTLPNIGYSQCTMCKTSAENSVRGEQKTGLGLNDGIALLVSIPYAAVGLLGFIRYRSYKNKSAQRNI